ncbi:putative secreted protein (Por secretion system target) [Nonlabens dokdonensis]|jgi:hypothetical protein|uniref:Fibronectin type III domain protein n=2 Tax=Nonlabens dokdonensis TaxID=328515 RepID=L7W738_NONDD|nr:T9SS type A sorting domain-containing protein [Nonlabens dokdonensis]AGC77495.1 fibronectin type III domain protein [Nonlabens dokdonensis DSW-6]PZX39948.1 putative secreted protein (Por secretion system target) [Nonlabens dokdonensis]
MKKITFLLILFITNLGFAQPSTSPAAPTNNAVDVISIFGDTYTNIATNYDPNWGQSGHTQVNPAFDPGNGELLLAYPNFNYQGTELTSTNASTMEFLHVDIWTSASPGATDIQVSPINSGSGAGETLVSIAYTSGTWTSVDIPKSSFTGMTWDNVFQMKFAANGPGSTVPVDIYLDNVYFWKNPTVAGADATLSTVEIDNAPLANFSAGVFSYNVDLPAGTTTVPQVTLATATDAGATVVINQATALPGDATIGVTSANGMSNETYTISFAAVGPSMGTATPPNRPAADVISIFSDAYTDIAVDTFDTSWCPGGTSDVVVAGEAMKRIDGLGCEGIDWQGARTIDATGFTHFHMDVFIDEPNLIGKEINMKFSQWGGTGGEVSAFNINVGDGAAAAQTLVNGWNIIDVTIDTAFTGDTTRNDIVQFVITSNVPTIWYDNLYLHKNTTASVNDFSIAPFKVYPNPSSSEWTISSTDTILQSVQVYDLSGKLVISQEVNNDSVLIDANSLTSGVYIAKVTSAEGTQNLKLVKN